MRVGIPKESRAAESRVAGTPASVKKLVKKGLRVAVERGAGVAAGFTDQEYASEGAELVDRAAAFGSEIVLKVHKPSAEELPLMKTGALLISFLEPYLNDGVLEKLAQAKIDSLSMEMIPRTSRAQSMDALSSQANIAGYRAVIEAANRYRRFFPMMMTSAGMNKPAKTLVLGAGVAGLQAIATAKRLGSTVEAFDVRPEVKEQIQSLGAKYLELDIGEAGTGQGGYAKELSEEGKRKQQAALTERLKKFDIVISTANVPGRKAPTLITEEAVRGMRAGSVIIDMAAPSGGNCPLTELDKVVEKHGVVIVGLSNYPSLVAADASQFYAQNLVNLLGLVFPDKATDQIKLNLEDDILAGSLATHQGQVKVKR
ncbi:MAG TPA: Re/Si-specific NAD(P)(+) transhydrogenase subunit alpha [Bdellovibrionales bacterium]|nr:Re/Si-specific NAD(P)(+) transhydrogenase subunit alpha [Bdellovibrionales bacterium]